MFLLGKVAAFYMELCPLKHLRQTRSLDRGLAFPDEILGEPPSWSFRGRAKGWSPESK
jgi:hypothetical protein